MSTSIVTFRPADFSKSRRYINSDALSLFAEISVTLLLFTVAVWWLFNWRERRKDKKAELRRLTPLC